MLGLMVVDQIRLSKLWIAGRQILMNANNPGKSIKAISKIEKEYVADSALDRPMA